MPTPAVSSRTGPIISRSPPSAPPALKNKLEEFFGRTLLPKLSKAPSAAALTHFTPIRILKNAEEQIDAYYNPKTRAVYEKATRNTLSGSSHDYWSGPALVPARALPNEPGRPTFKALKASVNKEWQRHFGRQELIPSSLKFGAMKGKAVPFAFTATLYEMGAFGPQARGTKDYVGRYVLKQGVYPAMTVIELKEFARPF
jgi:hypothetical protein